MQGAVKFIIWPQYPTAAGEGCRKLCQAIFCVIGYAENRLAGQQRPGIAFTGRAGEYALDPGLGQFAKPLANGLQCRFILCPLCQRIQRLDQARFKLCIKREAGIVT